MTGAFLSVPRLMHCLVTSIFLYACVSWTLTVELQRRIQAMEMRCYCKILCMSYKDYVTNEEVCAKIWFIRSGQNHLARHRQKMRPESNIGEGIGLEFAKSQRAVENRGNGGN